MLIADVVIQISPFPGQDAWRVQLWLDFIVNESSGFVREMSVILSVYARQALLEVCRTGSWSVGLSTIEPWGLRRTVMTSVMSEDYGYGNVIWYLATKSWKMMKRVGRSGKERKTVKRLRNVVARWWRAERKWRVTRVNCTVSGCGVWKLGWTKERSENFDEGFGMSPLFMEITAGC